MVVGAVRYQARTTELKNQMTAMFRLTLAISAAAAVAGATASKPNVLFIVADDVCPPPPSPAIEHNLASPPRGHRAPSNLHLQP